MLPYKEFIVISRYKNTTDNVWVLKLNHSFDFFLFIPSLTHTCDWFIENIEDVSISKKLRERIEPV